MQSLSLESNGSLGNSYLACLFNAAMYVHAAYVHVCLYSLSLSISSLPWFTVSSSSRVYVYTRLRALLLFLLAHCRCHDNAKYTFFSLSLSFRLVSSLGSSVAACNVRTSPSSLPPPLVCIVSNAAGSRALSLREKSSSFSFSRANRDNIEETRQGNRCYTLLVRPLCRVDTFFPFNLR